MRARDIPLLHPTDRGSEYCGNRETHEYQLYLTEDIEHTRTKVKHPQTNGICERFHKTIQNEFYATAFRRKIYNSLEELQVDLDAWVLDYNEQRTHSGKHCFGKTPMQTFLDSKHIAIEKQLNRTFQTTESVLATASLSTIWGNFWPSSLNPVIWLKICCTTCT